VSKKIALLTAIVLAAAPFALGDEIYKWTDAQGRTHYSNRGAATPDDSSTNEPSDSGEQGWESVLEKQRGSEKFQDKAEATINSLELQVVRKKRDRTQAQDELETTQAGIIRAQGTNSPDLPTLRAREATEISNLRKIDLELGALHMAIAKIRAMKAAERDQRTAR
jgi:Domain of unknown function (DUF4124)